MKDFRLFDKTILLMSLVVIAGAGIINSLRPQNFGVQAIITVIGVFVLYLVVPFNFKYQSFLASLATVGEALIILFVLKQADLAVIFTLFLGLFLANLIAAIGSWQLHSYRRKIFLETVRRTEAQHALEQQTKHLEDLVVERTEKLKNAERFAAIGETAAMLGHDLRNPLTGIAGASYYLKSKYSASMDSKGLDMLQVIDSNVAYSNKIINDLLDYSKNLTLELEKTNPQIIVSEALGKISFPSNVVIINATENQPEINVDFTKMQRVFVNLAKNAADAMPEGGTLKITSARAGQFVKISFADSGPGISLEDQKKLFQPLFTTKAKGMGFGLAICRKIVEAHDGKILVESTPGKGTIFTVVLPP
jgi:signal transduction histidine kinase